jgi:hypothetical protein
VATVTSQLLDSHREEMEDCDNSALALRSRFPCSIGDAISGSDELIACADRQVGWRPSCCALDAAAGARAAPIDCGPAPSVKCQATEVFALAKTLAADQWFRRTLAFAEQNLAPRDIKTALEYVVWDNLDPLPWEDIEWMAAGRTVRSSHQARQTAENRRSNASVDCSPWPRTCSTRTTRGGGKRSSKTSSASWLRQTDNTDEANSPRDDAALRPAWANRSRGEPHQRLRHRFKQHVAGSSRQISCCDRLARAGLARGRTRQSALSMHGSSWLRMRSSAAIKPKPRAWRSVLGARWMAGSDRSDQVISLARVLLTAGRRSRRQG